MPHLIKKRHLHRRKVPERCFIVYSKSRFLDQAHFLRCQDTYLCTWSWIYEQSLICYFLNMVLVYPVRCQIGGTEGREQCMQGGTGGENLKKSAHSTPQKKYFFRVFLKKFFRAYILFPLLYQKKEKKLPPKIFWKKGLTWDAPRCTIETLQGGRPKDTRCAVYGIRFEKSNV